MGKLTKKDRIKVLERLVKTLIQSMINLEEWSSCADNMLTELNHALPDPEYDAKYEAQEAGIDESLDRHRERLGLNKPQLKQLTQSVFNGLDEKWRFAVIQNNGFALICTKLPFVAFGGSSWDWNGYSDVVGKGYDASNWQNSLIERESKELLEVDLSSELTGSEICLKLLNLDRDVMCDVKDGDYRLIFAHDGEFFISHNKGERECHKRVTPINNQGEPLTASEVGL